MLLGIGTALITFSLLVWRIFRKKRLAVDVAIFAILMFAASATIMWRDQQLQLYKQREAAKNAEFEKIYGYISELETAGGQMKETLTKFNFNLQTLQPATEDGQDVKSIYNPEQSEPSAQARMDVLKRRYEEIFVAFYLLRKCEKTLPTDAHIIISALAQEMASINAPSRLQYDILTSSQGSYKELYAKTACKEEVITPMDTQFRGYVSALIEQYNLK